MIRVVGWQGKMNDPLFSALSRDVQTCVRHNPPYCVLYLGYMKINVAYFRVLLRIAINSRDRYLFSSSI